MSRWPAPHWPSLRRRARVHGGLLLLAGAIVAVVTCLVGVAPPLLRATADDAVRAAVSQAAGDANVVVHAPFEYDDGLSGRIRAPRLAEAVDDFRDRAVGALDPGLRAVLRPPIASVTSPTLTVTAGDTPRSFRLSYFANAVNGGGPAVTWIAGGPPRAAVPEADRGIEVPYNGPPWPVQVGLSEADADALKVGPGDRIPLEDQQRNVKHVEVSGIFRATDSTDPAWRLAPWLLRPVPAVAGVGSTLLGGLLSRDSLPDARLAFEQDDLRRTVVFTPEPGAFSQDSAGPLAAAVIGLKATSGSPDGSDMALQWESSLDGVLRNVRNQINAAFAQASVLLTAVLAIAVLVLLLAADLLIRRRAGTLAAARQRGASLLDLAAEQLVESAAVALLAAAAGLAVARAIAPGVEWSWAVPVFLAAAAAAPVFGTVAAARATNDRRVPANRSARRWARRTGQLRRAAVAGAVLVAAVIALVALDQRGVRPAATSEATGSGAGLAGGAALPVSGPALGALAGALLLLRFLPVGTRLMLRWALRARRPLAVFGAARAAATATRVLPVLALLVAAALTSFAVTLDATVRKGLVDGAWHTVGGDARLDIAPGVAAARPEQLAAAPGVDQAVAAQIIEAARVAVNGAIVSPRLVIVDAVAFERLRASTPLPDVPGLDQLVAPGRGAVPALVRSADGSLAPGMRLELLRDGAPAIQLVATDTAPVIGSAPVNGSATTNDSAPAIERDVVLVDAATLAAAGQPTVPNTVWVTGPGAAAAANAVAAGTVGVSVVLRADLERARRTAPLTTGLLRLAWTAAAIMLALGVLALALGAAAGAPERWQTLARLRTLGLRPRDARWVAAGELLPPVVLAAISGPLLGVLLADLTLGPLELGVLTGQAGDPALVRSWWGTGLVTVAFLATVAVTVPVESAVRRRRRLAEVLRVGEV